MTWIAAASLGGAAIGALSSYFAGSKQAEAAQEAARLQSEAAQRQMDLQKSLYQEQQQQLQPWRQAGQNALAQLTTAASTPYTFDRSQLDPGYAFRLNEGLNALKSQAAARGGLLSGNTLKALTDYAQGAASNEYQNAFNRYQSRIGQLQSLAGIGQSAGQQSQGLAQSYGANIGNLGMQGAEALGQGQIGAASGYGSGYMGAANTLNNALSNYYNYMSGQKYLDALTKNQPPAMGTGR